MHDLAFVGGTFAFGFGWQLEDIVESRVTSDAPVSSLESQKGSADRKKYDLSGERLSCNYSCIPFCDCSGHNHLLTSEKLHRAQMTYGLHLPLSLEYVLAFSGMDEGDTFLSNEQ